jgi:hypothetical protein
MDTINTSIFEELTLYLYLTIQKSNLNSYYKYDLLKIEKKRVLFILIIIIDLILGICVKLN